jgi:siroheme decarboxylase
MSRPPVELDDLDRAILNRIQAEVPLVPRPFAALGRDFGLTENQMIARVQRMWDQGVIRRLGPIINYPAWEMSGVLVAAKLDEANLDAAKTAVAAHPEITHAYLREHEWNLWFTVIAENETARDAIIDRVTEVAGLKDVRKLPKLKGFKLGVKFEA